MQLHQGNSSSGMVALMQAWGHVSSHLQQPSSSPPNTADGGDDATTQLILEALKLAVRSLSRVPVDSTASGARLPEGPTSSSSSTPAVRRSLALAAALAELYASGLPLDAASIAAGVVADAVDAGALHIRTVKVKLGLEVAGLVHDMLAVRHAPDRTPVYDDANSRWETCVNNLV
jgi:(p)ppGpp synthase/HD superfamily hydrolase